MKNINSLTGSIVALVTPMQKQNNNSIDYVKFKQLINWHIEQGTKAIVIAGSTGEAATLEEHEWVKLLEIAKDIADNTPISKDNRTQTTVNSSQAISTISNTSNDLNSSNKLTIIAGTGTNCTNSTIKKTCLAEKIGIDAALVVTPYYNKPTQTGLLLHYSELANQTNLPIILYNVPSRTGCDLLPDTVAILSKINNIIGIKEATGRLERVTELKHTCRDNFVLLSGDDSSFLEFMLLGGIGVISVTANVIPTIMNKICKLILSQQNSLISIAKQIHVKLIELHKALMIESNPIPVKWLLAYLGKIDEAYRSPLTTLSKKHHSILIDAYQRAINNIDLKIKEECNS